MAAPGLAPHKKGAKRTGATIVFADETGFLQRPSVHRTWGPRGRTPVTEEHFNWKRLSATGALAWRPVEADTRLFLSVKPGAVDSAQVVSFLRSLRRHLRGQVVLIWDGRPAHRSRVVAEHLRSQRRWLRGERLPADAPELNPLGYLWATLKNKDTANYSPDTLEDLDGQLRRAARRLRRRDALGLSLVKHAGLLSDKQYLLLCETQ
jgi:transposase